MKTADQAASWFARQRSGAWSEADAMEFSEWLASDPLHMKSWAAHRQTWERTLAVRDNPRILAARESARVRAARHKSLQRLWRSGLGLAASLLMGIAVWWGFFGNARSPLAPALMRSASTEIGESSHLTLPDGSKVILNTATAISTDYSGEARLVNLKRGEAFFDVAKDPLRPFIVLAGERQVIAVGTAFSVRLQDKQLRVTLVEGKVRVRPKHGANRPEVTLTPDTALVAQGDGNEHVERLDAVRETSWIKGRLIFEGETLAEVVAEMNRYTADKLVIADQALGTRKVSGVFEPGRASTFANALEAYGIAKPKRQTGGVIFLENP